MSVTKPSLPDKTTKIPKQTFALLFSEVVQYCHAKSESIDQFSQNLQSMGYPIGCTILEVLEQNPSSQFRRAQKEVPMLLLLKEKIWSTLFGYNAHGLEQQVDDASCYMLYDDKPMITQFISHPPEIKNQFNCCSFVAGIIEGILCSAGFQCKVSTHPNPAPNLPDRVVFLIKFAAAAQ